MSSRAQVLVAAMNQNDYSLLAKLNIQSDDRKSARIVWKKERKSSY